MDFLASVKIVLRYWWLVLLGLAATAAGAFAVVQRVQPSYTANGSVVFLRPAIDLPGSTADGKAIRNPLLDFEGSLNVTTELMVQVMNGEQAAKDLLAKGATATYAVEQNLETRSPLLLVSVRGLQPDLTIRTLSLVIEEAKSRLIAEQVAVGADSGSYITVRVLSQATEAALDRGSQVRAAAAVMAVGGVMSLSSAFLLEAIRRGRERRRLGLVAVPSVGYPLPHPPPVALNGGAVPLGPIAQPVAAAVPVVVPAAAWPAPAAGVQPVALPEMPGFPVTAVPPIPVPSTARGRGGSVRGRPVRGRPVRRRPVRRCPLRCRPLRCLAGGRGRARRGDRERRPAPSRRAARARPCPGSSRRLPPPGRRYPCWPRSWRRPRRCPRP